MANINPELLKHLPEAEIKVKYIYFDNFKPSARYLKKCKGKRKQQHKKVLPYTDQSERFLDSGGTFYWDPATPRKEHNGGTVISPRYNNE